MVVSPARFTIHTPTFFYPTSVTPTSLPAFDDPGLLGNIATLTPDEVDRLDFGVLGFDEQALVRIYSRYESHASGLSMASVLGRNIFTTVAPCMNNFMVSQRFEDAAAAQVALDVTIDFMLTLRMRPTKVKLRLLAAPGAPYRYVLVKRLG